MKQNTSSGIAAMLFVGFTSLGLIGFTTIAHGQASTTSQTGSASSAAGTTAGQPLGDYARQIRKTSGPASKPKVFDNDNLPTQDTLSIVGPPEQPAGDASAATKSDDTTAAAPPAATEAAKSSSPDDKTASAGAPKSPEEEEAAKQEAWKQWSGRISTQKDQIDLLARELDVLQREYQLRAAAIFADVGNRLRNQAAWDQQDADYKQKIADKQKALDDAKQKLDDLQEQARKAGVPASVREP